MECNCCGKEGDPLVLEGGRCKCPSCGNVQAIKTEASFGLNLDSMTLFAAGVLIGIAISMDPPEQGGPLFVK